MSKKAEKKKIKEVETKEDKAMGTWMPIGVLIGTVVGMMLSFANDNIIFLGCGSCAGLLIGTVLGSIATEGIEIKVGTAKKKKTTKKKNK